MRNIRSIMIKGFSQVNGTYDHEEDDDDDDEEDKLPTIFHLQPEKGKFQLKLQPETDFLPEIILYTK